jgi:putative DNA primase/helicase
MSKESGKISDTSPYFVPSDSFSLIRASDLVNLKLPPKRKLWGRRIQSNQTGMIFGPRGAGKTYAGLGFGISMASGAGFLGRSPDAKKRVTYLDGEMDLVTIQGRVKTVSESLGVEPPPRLRMFTPEMFTDLLPSINTPEGQKQIDEIIGKEWDVLFIDNYSAWSNDGRETAEAWAPVMRWMLAHKRAGRCVIVLHHAGKGGTQRGTSKHEDALDWSICLKPYKATAKESSVDALRFTLEWQKARHLSGRQAGPIAVTMTQDKEGALTWKHENGHHEGPRKIEALRLHREGATNAAISEKLGVNASTISRMLKDK